jgi:energy-coupling factor transporter ATP-binding protein EcfA2
MSFTLQAGIPILAGELPLIEKMLGERIMNTKLILVEGLPGSGKSTTARLLQEILVQQNVKAELYMEGNLDHPADYESVAYFTEEEFTKLLEESGSFSRIIQDKVMVKRGRRLLPYMKLKTEFSGEFPDELLAEISKKDVYEPPLEENIAVIAESWEEFAKRAGADDKVYIFECCFIQNPVTVGMIKYGAPAGVSVDYVKKLADAVKNLNPLLVYVKQEDIESSFRKAVTERPDDWFNGFVHYYTSQGYGLKNQLNGLEGTIDVLKARQELEFEILEQLNLRKVIVDNSRFELNQHRERLTKILENEC